MIFKNSMVDIKEQKIQIECKLEIPTLIWINNMNC